MWNGLLDTKSFTPGCPHLYVGTDHKPLLGLLGDTAIEKIDNPWLVRLKEKTLGWHFQMLYIPGKLLGGTDALSRYGVKHCGCGNDEGNKVDVRKHYIGLLADSSNDQICQILGGAQLHQISVFAN